MLMEDLLCADTALRTCHFSFHFFLSVTRGGRFYGYAHFSDDIIEAARDKVISQSHQASKRDRGPRL